LEIYGLSKRIIAPDDAFESSIHAMGNHSRSRRGLQLPKPHCWTGNPLHSPLGLWFNVRRLGLRTWTSCVTNNLLRRVGVKLDSPETASIAGQGVVLMFALSAAAVAILQLLPR
jgi:hypothetical protein